MWACLSAALWALIGQKPVRHPVVGVGWRTQLDPEGSEYFTGSEPSSLSAEPNQTFQISTRKSRCAVCAVLSSDGRINSLHNSSSESVK